MNTLSHFLTIALLLLWSIVVQADTTTTFPQYSDHAAPYNNSHSVNEPNTECDDVPKSDENALVIYLPSQQRLYVLPSQGSPYQLETRTAEQRSRCFILHAGTI